jgi:hypothetical protein
VAARGPRTAGRLRRRLRHRRDDGQLDRPGRRPPAGADAGRLGPGRRRPHRRSEGARARGGGPARHRRPRAALPRPRPADRGRRRRAGPGRAGRAPSGARDGRGADHRRAAGRQPPLGLVRPVRRVHRPGAPARGVGARRRRFRPVAAADHVAAPPRGGHRGRRLVGHRRAQDAQHAVRLRHRDRPRPGAAAQRRDHAGELPHPRVGTRATRWTRRPSCRDGPAGYRSGRR